MEQRDYLLREIEKIGQVLRAILNRITGSKSDVAVSTENQFNEVKNELLDKANFDLSEFSNMSDENALKYIENFSGLNLQNIEQLAQILEKLASIETSKSKDNLFKKALLLLQYCKSQDKTFSIERETQIARINETLT